MAMLPMLALAQTEEFTIATLNVDGLPKDVLGIPINPDGPNEKYSPEIGDYLAAKDYDFVGFQENFNYYDLIFPKLDANYSHDEAYGKIDIKHLQIPFPNDGINMAWRQEIEGGRTDSVSWRCFYGLATHASDGLTKKGFRRYEFTLQGGSHLVVYNGHWDGSTDVDEAICKDGPDRMARMSQWRQLRDSILNNLDERPVIVIGDMNSYYARDSVKIQFIDFIEATGKARVYDAWIEMEKQGEYPELVKGPVMRDLGSKSWCRQGEMLDKILYINPVDGAELKALEYAVDSTTYVCSDDNTRDLGDHCPVVVRFSITRQGGTGIAEVPMSQLPDCYYDLNGRRLNGLPARKGIYLYRGKKVVVK